MDEDDKQHHEELLRKNRQRLHMLEKQQAQFGVDTPPHIATEIKEIQNRINQIESELGTSSMPPPVPVQFFALSESAEFILYFERLAYQARRIVLIGTGINILHHDSVLLNLIARTNEAACHLEVYVANPYSPAVETRLVEEETGDIKPRIGKNGIISLLKTLLEKQSGMENPLNFTLKLFSNYPTLSLYILDDEYFIYPYGYALLGTRSPVAHYSKKNPAHQPMIDFLEGQYRRVKSASVEAKLVLDLHSGNTVDVDKLIPFAVYFVPTANSKLYEFGSELLGYDIRGDRLLASPYHDYVGSASDFGFHLTIADALYFAHTYEIELVSKQIEFITRDFHPFWVSVDVRGGFPDKHSISLICRDSSGSLEALHHELVFHCYRRAVASNYSLKLASADRDINQQRTNLMIQRYLAPYILQRFRPHFTLLTAVPPENVDFVTREIKKLFAQRVRNAYINIKGVALMRRSRPNRPWQIEQEIQFRS
jgi:hypothetical protein